MSSTASNANEDGETAMRTGADSWGVVGRELLRAELERVGEQVLRNAFRQASTRIAAGEELTREDIQAMRDAVKAAERVIELAARASTEATSVPGVWEVLNDQARAAYVDEVQKRQDSL